jgi:flavodoxin
MLSGRSMDRRTLLARSLALGAGLLLGGCAEARNTSASSSPLPTTTGTPDAGPRVLLAYFSRPGENYHYGGRRTLEIGNTQVIADMIAGLAAVDVHRIEAADPYPSDYEETVERNRREQDDDARPAMAREMPSADGYDIVLLGCPVWNVRAPMIMRTFLDGLDLAGKTIHPFVTYAVSGMGSVADDYVKLCPDATVGEGLAVQGEEVLSAQPQVGDWLREIGLLRT